MTPENDKTVEIAVAIGRLEEGQAHMLESLKEFKAEITKNFDKIESRDADFKSRLSEVESDVKVLKETRFPKIHPVTYVVGLIAIGSFLLVVLDRFYA